SIRHSTSIPEESLAVVQAAPTSVRPPRRTRRPCRKGRNLAVACRSLAVTVWRLLFRGVLAHSRSSGGRPAAGPRTRTEVSVEPRRRRRFRKEVMGDEHGRQVLVPRCDCEEPSAPAGLLSSRPAGACLLKETTTAPGR